MSKVKQAQYYNTVDPRNNASQIAGIDSTALQGMYFHYNFKTSHNLKLRQKRKDSLDSKLHFHTKCQLKTISSFKLILNKLSVSRASSRFIRREQRI